MVFDVESEFWLDDFKRLFGYLTLYDSSQTGIDIFLSDIVSHFSLVIL